VRDVDKDGAIVITFDDDRTERWTPVGKRMVVEHGYQSSQFPCGAAVRGIADRERYVLNGNSVTRLRIR
jgi:hypothetical protein